MHRVLLPALGCALALSCGGGGSPASPTPPPTSNNPNRITITAGGVAAPSQITVAPGARVLFVNEDSRRHDMVSDPHPEHTECPEINQAGLLAPGQSRETGNMVVVRTCGFHDHDNPNNAGLRGRIIVRP